MPTPNFNLPIYGPGDTAALDTLLNGQSSAIDAALLASEWRAGGTTSARTGLAAPRRKEGLQFYETDASRGFVRGAKWSLAPSTGGPMNVSCDTAPTLPAAPTEPADLTAGRIRHYRPHANTAAPARSRPPCDSAGCARR